LRALASDHTAVKTLSAVGLLVAAAIASFLLLGREEEKRADTGPALSTPRVAQTASQPGYAPFALITYRDRAGHPCHGIGTLTKSGPRVLDAPELPLERALATRGACLGPRDGDISLQVRQARPGAPHVVGGLARAGVLRVVVAGQRVRPRGDGSFLVLQPASAGSLGTKVELQYRAGHTRRLSLRRVAS
jgi:hypothetical protein